MGKSQSRKFTLGGDLFTQVRPVGEETVPPTPVPHERVGPYELVFKLASGGMADIYLARDCTAPALDQVVALKRIHRHLVGKPGYRAMFLDEARIAFQITHPNVCTILDFGTTEGEYYLAMEYLVGEPLGRLMNRVVEASDRSDPAFASCLRARTIADACAGLHAAHELKSASGSVLNVVHRDVTPRNLFLTYEGHTKVIDFGIATAELKPQATGRGKLRGNVAYMAPEQLTGGPVDRRIDIWAMGVTLWEMVAMRRLFKRQTPTETIAAVAYDEIASLSDVTPGLPKGLDSVVLKALQRDPDERWQTAREMELAIREVLDAQPVVVGPADLAEWMQEVFPFGEAQKQQLVRMARLGSADAPNAAPQEEKQK